MHVPVLVKVLVDGPDEAKKTDRYILHENRFFWFICDEFVGLVYVRLTVLHKLRNTNNP